jgi:multidrug resistance efflux pump
MKTMVDRFLIILVLSVLIVGCTSISGSADTAVATPQPLLNVNDNVVSASAEVVAGKWANLSFMVGAQKVDVLVKAGDDVKEGDLLASFPENELPQSIITAKADLIIAQKSLDDLLKADTALAQAVITLRNAQETYDKAANWREELNGKIHIKEIRYKKIGNKSYPFLKEYRGYADEKTIAKADEDLALAKARLDDAKRELDRLTNLENSPEVIAAKTRLDSVQSIIDQSKLLTPFDGTVVELNVNSGEMVSPGSPVLLLADLSTLQVKTTDLNEVDVARVQVGDAVKVSFDALPDTIVTGRVSEISLKNAVGSGVYYDVFITLDEIPEGLRWGMSAFVEIEVSK